MKKIFKEAHKMTREIVKEYKVNYQAQFRLNLSYLLNNKEEKEMTNEMLEQEIFKQNKRRFEITAKEWQKGNNHRLYLNMINKTNRAFIDAYIDLNTGAVVVSSRRGGRWILAVEDTVRELLEENKEEIIKHNIKVKEVVESGYQSSANNNYRNTNLTDELLGLSHKLSNEDLEDITGLRRNEDYNPFARY